MHCRISKNNIYVPIRTSGKDLSASSLPQLPCFHRVDKSTQKYVRLRGDPLALKGDFDGVVTRTRPVVTRNQERVLPKPVLGGLARAHLYQNPKNASYLAFPFARDTPRPNPGVKDSRLGRAFLNLNNDRKVTRISPGDTFLQEISVLLSIYGKHLSEAAAFTTLLAIMVYYKFSVIPMAFSNVTRKPLHR
ncbi:hypothetical protein D5086_019618 [Populus alba]|uniref:Uncharacterized protein n=1 Tax=Populus alba TaxID=43335 RepID=A0ACC4BHS4_POPAL